MHECEKFAGSHIITTAIWQFSQSDVRFNLVKNLLVGKLLFHGNVPPVCSVMDAVFVSSRSPCSSATNGSKRIQLVYSAIIIHCTQYIQ